MSTTTDSRALFRRPLDLAPSGVEACRAVPAQPDAAPIVVAVDNSRAATAAVQAAVSLGADLAAPLVFVYVRRGPSSALGEPYYQRRLDAEMASGRRALTDALAVAEEAGVPATGEQLAGNPAATRRRVRPVARRAAGRARLASTAAAQRRGERRHPYRGSTCPRGRPHGAGRVAGHREMGVRSRPDRCSYP